MSWVAKGVAWLPVILLEIVLVYSAFTHLYVFCWEQVTVVHGRGDAAAVFFFPSLFLLGLTHMCLFLSVKMDPGFVSRDWSYRMTLIAERGRGGDRTPPTSLCSRCSPPLLRPERAHHCNICGKCVRRMDHHCPFINNCVGFGNYKQFLLLVLYGTISTTYELFTILLVFYLIPPHLEGDSTETWLLAACLIGCGMCILLALFFVYILFPVVTNRTRVESSFWPSCRRYRLSLWENCTQYLGDDPWAWMWPTVRAHSLERGYKTPHTICKCTDCTFHA